MYKRYPDVHKLCTILNHSNLTYTKNKKKESPVFTGKGE